MQHSINKINNLTDRYEKEVDDFEDWLIKLDEDIDRGGEIQFSDDSDDEIDEPEIELKMSNILTLGPKPEIQPNAINASGLGMCDWGDDWEVDGIQMNLEFDNSDIDDLNGPDKIAFDKNPFCSVDSNNDKIKDLECKCRYYNEK